MIDDKSAERLHSAQCVDCGLQ